MAVLNNPRVSGWDIIKVANYNGDRTAFRYRVKRVNGNWRFSAREAAREAGVPCDKNGWVTLAWVEKHYCLTRKIHYKNFVQ